MPDDDLPKSSDPGRNAGARVRWGEQVLQAVQGIRFEVSYLKKWASWALGTAIGLILLLGATAASVLTNQNAMLANDANMAKTMEKFDKTVGDLNGKFDKTEGGLNKTVGDLDKNVAVLSTKIGELNTNVEHMNKALAEFQHSLDEFNKRSDANAAKLEKVNTTVDALKKSIDQTKGESFSEFMTQRALITKNDLKIRTDKTSPLIFDLKLPYESLSQARSSRPSATLALPHAAFLDSISFQIKVKRVDVNILSISIASKETSLDSLEKFLKNDNGVIPLDLTIRTPIETSKDR